MDFGLWHFASDHRILLNDYKLNDVKLIMSPVASSSNPEETQEQTKKQTDTLSSKPEETQEETQTQPETSSSNTEENSPQ
jgi:hypothetical protein